MRTFAIGKGAGMAPRLDITVRELPLTGLGGAGVPLMVMTGTRPARTGGLPDA